MIRLFGLFFLTGVAMAGGPTPPGFSMVFAPDTIGPSSTSALNYTITNTESTPVEDLAFTNVLPAGVVLANPANPVSGCEGVLTAADGGNSVALTGGRLAANDSCTVTVFVTASTPGVYTNTSGDLTSTFGNSGSASDDLTVNANAPGFSKAFVPNAIPFGGVSRLTLTIDASLVGSNTFNASFTDILPIGVEVASPSNLVSTCTGTVTATAGSNLIEFFSGFFTPGSSCTIDVDVTSRAPGDKVNASGGLTSTQGNSGFAVSSLSVGLRPAFFKEFTDNPAPPGGTATLEFMIANLDRESVATGITFTDQLDADLAGVTAIGLPLSDVCGPGSTLSGSALVTLTGGTLAPGETCEFSIQVQIPAGAPGGFYTNTTSALDNDAGQMSGPVSDDLEVNEGPTVSMSFTDDPIASGDTATLEFTVGNNFGFPIESIAFTMPISTVLSGATILGLPQAGDCGPSTVSVFSDSGNLVLSFTGGMLGVGETCVVPVTLQTPPGTPAGSYTFTTSEITAFFGGMDDSFTGFGGDLRGRSASDDLEVVGGPDLTKNFLGGPVRAGDPVTLEFTLSHDVNALADAVGIGFTDDLDAVLSGLTATGLPLNDVCGPGSQISGGSTLTFSGGTLSPGASCTFSVQVQTPAAAAPGTYPNTTSTVSAQVSGLNVTGAAGSADLEIAGLTFAKSFTGNPALPGSQTTLEFTLTNESVTTAISSIVFTDNLSPVLTGLEAVGLPANDVCGAGSQISGTNFLIFSGGSLAAGGSCTFSVTLQIPAGAAAGEYTNQTSQATAMAGGNPIFSAVAIDTLEIINPLSLSMAFTDDPVVPGSPATLEYTLANLDTVNAASSVAFTHDLDAALSGLAAVGLPAANVCGAGSSISGTGLLSFTGGSLAAGGSCTFSITVQTPGAVSAGAAVTTTTSALSGMINGAGVVGDPASADLEFQQLSFSKAFGGDAAPTATTTLTFTIVNPDPVNAATGIAFSDDLDAALAGMVALGLPASDVCGPGSSLSGTSVISLANGSLAAGETCVINVTVQVPAGALPGTYTNVTSSIQAVINGLNGGAAPASADLLVNPSPGFSKSFAPNPGAVGQAITLTFTIDNTGSTIAAANLDFTDMLPAGLTVASPANAATTCSGGTLTATSGSDVVSYNGGTVAAGASCTVTVDVVAAMAGNFVNTSGALTSSSGDSGTATDSLRINPPPGFSKSFAPNPIAIGEITTLTFIIDNTGSNVAALSMDFTDTLPAGATIANPANAATTCSGGTLTAVVGTDVVAYTGGGLSAGSTCTVTVDVVAAAAGNYINTSGALTSSLGDSGTATASLRVNPPPGFSKSFAPNPVAVGQVTTLTFVIDNTGSNAAALSMDFTDTLPAGLTIASPANAATTCSGGTLTAAVGTDVITYTGGGLSAGSTCTVIVDVVGAASGDYLNTSGDLTSTLGNSGPASDSLRIDPAPGFSKSFAPNPTAVNAIAALTFTIDNSGATLAATGLDFTDTLPAGLTIASPANAVTTCSGGTLTAPAGGTVISYSGGTAPASGACTVTVDVVAAAAGDYLNTSGDLTSSLGNSGPASDSLRVNPQPGFSKIFAPDTIALTEITTLTFTIDNAGSTVDATGLDFTDNLPAGLEIASPANAATTCVGGTLTAPAGGTVITYTGGSAPAGGSCTVTVDIAATASGDQVNVSGDLTSSLGNSGPATAMVRVDPPPLFSKSFAPAMIDPGAVSTLTFTIDNLKGSQPATSLDFTDNLPAGVMIATPPNAVVGCTGGTLTAPAGGTAISYSGGTVAATSTCTITVDVTSGVPGTVTNTSGDLTSSAGNSGPAVADLTVADAADLVITKTDSPDPVAAGAQLTYTITVQNNGPSDALDVVVTDTLPAGVTFVSSSGCDNDPNGAPTCDLGVITAGSSKQATLTVTVDSGLAAGVLTNLAEVTSSTPERFPGDESVTEDTTVVLEADLGVALGGPTIVNPGQAVTYTVSVDNNGPSDALGSTVSAAFPASLTGVAWTCVASAGSSCAAAGSGDISDTADLLAGGTAVYTVTAAVGATFVGDIAITAQVAPAAGVTDNNPANDNDTLNAVSTSAAEIFGSLIIVNPPPVTEAGSVIYQVGDTVIYRATLTNSSPFAQFDDPNSNEFFNALPAGLRLVDAVVIIGGGVVGVDTAANTVVWNGSIPGQSVVEIEIQTVIEAGASGSSIANQGEIRYDSDGDGVNDTLILTDDPSLPGASDPTVIRVSVPVPALSAWGLALFVLGLAVAALIIRRNQSRRRAAPGA